MLFLITYFRQFRLVRVRFLPEIGAARLLREDPTEGILISVNFGDCSKQKMH